MNCCNANGQCTQGQSCPAMQITRPGDLYLQPTAAITQASTRAEKMGFAVLLIFIYCVSAVVSIGTLLWLWVTYEQGLTDLFWALAALKS